MSRFSNLLAALLFLPALTFSQESPEKETSVPTEAEIAQAIADLSSSEFLKREKAAKDLWEAGRAAMGQLEAAVAESDDLEAKLRAEQILKKFRFGIFPDTPPELAEMLTLFRDGNPQQRRSILTQLLQKGEIDNVLDLINTLPAEERNTYAQTLFRNRSHLLVAPLILRGDARRAETVLSSMAYDPDGARNLAAYHFFSGSLDKAIKEEESKDDPARFERLTAFLRAKGDFKGALDAAKEIPSDKNRTDATAAIRVSEGDVPAYLEYLSLGGGTEALSLALTKATRSGDAGGIKKASDNLLAALRAEPDQIWYVTEAFLINDQPETILELLKTKPEWKDRAAEMLFEQRRPAEVLAVLGIEGAKTLEDIKPWVDKGLASLAKPTIGPAEGVPDEIRRFRLQTEAGLIHVARLHIRMGYLAEADRLFKRIGEAAVAAESAPHEVAFVLAEAAEANRIEASIHIVRTALEKWPEVGETLVPRLPLDDAGDWWGSVRNVAEFDADLLGSFDRFLQAYPDATTNPESQFDDKGEPVEINPAALKAATELVATVLKNAAEGGRPMFAGIGTRAEALGLLDLAEDAFLANAKAEAPGEPARRIDARGAVAAESGPGQALRALGDFHARHERWPDAAEAYRTAVEAQGSRDPVAIYDLSWALRNSGDEAGADDALKLARLLPLGDISLRNQLAEKMWERDDADAAHAEWKWIFENASPDDWEQGRAAQLLAEKAAEEKDYPRAAAYLDRLMYSTLQTSSAFNEIRSYMRVRFRSNYFRALAAIEEKDGPAAAAAAEAAFAHAPSDPTLSEEVFPALDGLGQKGSVDKMFARAFAINDATCSLFPEDAQAHNSLAWLSARSKRKLDEAMIHAKRAVELEPESAAYIDTLAEAHFANGDRAKAIELSEKAVSLMPDDEQLQDQLKRFKGE